MLHSAILVLTLVLAALPLSGAEKDSPIIKGRVTIVPNIGALREFCTMDKNDYIFGCTAFQELFSCSCRQVLDKYRLDVSVRVTPSIYLWKLQYLGHENDHIGDIRVAILRYMHDLDERGYASLEECSQVARRETAGFHYLLDTFKEDSSVKRHPSYRRRLPRLAERAP